jgi:hypothetical protein
MLSILYRYYNIFTQEFKETLNHYIVNHVFNQLFMHWNKQVRALFHLLLNFKIAKCQTENPELNPKMSFGLLEERGHHGEAINENILNLREVNVENKRSEMKKSEKKENSEYYLNMKEKLVQRIKKKKGGGGGKKESDPFEMDLLSSPIRSVSNFSESLANSHLMAKRKWSLAGVYEYEQPAPTEQEMSYLTLSLKEFDDKKK